MTKRIVIAGALAQKPRQAGHTWQFLQYLLGFRRLGCEVLLLYRLEPDMCVDESLQPCALDHSVNLRYFLDVMKRFELDDSFALLCDKGARFIGLARQEVIQRTKNSAMLLNIMGYLTDEEILGSASRRIFLDTDPGFGFPPRHAGLGRVHPGFDLFCQERPSMAPNLEIRVGFNISHRPSSAP